MPDPSYLKYTKKRPHYTPDSLNLVRECPACHHTRFDCERPRDHKPFYRTYGYASKKVQWRIRCQNKGCREPIGVILKPQYWDSAS